MRKKWSDEVGAVCLPANKQMHLQSWRKKVCLQRKKTNFKSNFDRWHKPKSLMSQPRITAFINDLHHKEQHSFNHPVDERRPKWNIKNFVTNIWTEITIHQFSAAYLGSAGCRNLIKEAQASLFPATLRLSQTSWDTPSPRVWPGPTLGLLPVE